MAVVRKRRVLGDRSAAAAQPAKLTSPSFFFFFFFSSSFSPSSSSLSTRSIKSTTSKLLFFFFSLPPAFFSTWRLKKLPMLPLANGLGLGVKVLRLLNSGNPHEGDPDCKNASVSSAVIPLLVAPLSTISPTWGS